MQRNAANRFASTILLSGVAMAAGAAACAGDNVGMAPTSSGRQVMLYVSQPLWSRGASSSRVYGLRIEEVRATPATPQSSAVGSLRRSVLVDLQIVPHSDIRIEFGKRFIWNFTHEAFGQQSSLSVGLPIMSVSVPDTPRPITAVSGLATLLPLSRVCGLWTCPISAAGFHSSSFDH